MDIAYDPTHVSAITNSHASDGGSSTRSADRSLTAQTRLRIRRDLQWTQVRPAARAGRGSARGSSTLESLTSSPSTRSLWIVFDPITRRSFRFGDEERWIIEQLDGHKTLAGIQQKFLQQFKSTEISLQSLADLCIGLIRSGLAHEVGVKRAQTKSTLTKLSISSFIVWRIRGIDADAWFARLALHCNWLFSAIAIRFWLAVAGLSTAGVLLEFPRLAAQASRWEWLIQPTNWGSLMIIFLVTRGLHELGHALACKRFGVRCPDIGLLIILGAPCVYCDVSECWKLSKFWQRAAIAAAGMYVELIVASCAAFAWLATVDGAVNTIALQSMFVCSISTIIINANPLMRFDGYYILSDFADEPNLRSRADSALWCLALQLILGLRAVRHMPLVTSTVRRRLLIGFSLAGWMYRVSVSLAMAAMIVAIYDGWHLVWFGRLLAVSLLVSWWVLPMFRLAKNVIASASRTGGRLRLSLLSAAMVIAIGLVPVPFRQFSSGWLQPKEMHGLYAPSTGQLVCIFARDGQRVVLHETLFEMRDPLLELQARAKAGQSERAQLQLASRRRDRYFQNTAAIDLSDIEAAAESAQQQAIHAARAVDRLKIKSAIEGKLMAMPAALAEEVGAIQTTSVPHSWVDESQLGRQVSKGTMLGAVCSDTHVAVLPLTDSQLAWIYAGSDVRLRPSSSSGEVLHGKVQSIVQLQEIDTSWRLISINAMADQQSSHATSESNAATLTPSPLSVGGYAAIVELPEAFPSLSGERIDAAFVAQSQTLAQLALRWSQENLRWLAD